MGLRPRPQRRPKGGQERQPADVTPPPSTPDQPFDPLQPASPVDGGSPVTPGLGTFDQQPGGSGRVGWRGRVADEGEALGVRLRFAYTHGLLLGARVSWRRLSPGEDDVAMESWELQVDQASGVAFSPPGAARVPLDPNVEVLLEVVSLGAPAQLTGVNWVLAGDLPRARAPSLYPEDFPVEFAKSGPLGKYEGRLLAGLEVPTFRDGEEALDRLSDVEILSVGGLFADRLSAVGDQCKAQKFFLQLDLATDASHASTSDVDAMNRVRFLLNERRYWRVSFAEQGQVCPSTVHAPLTPDDLVKLEACSDLLWSVIDAHYSASERGVRGKGLDWAYVMFVTDKLVTTHPDDTTQSQLQSHGAPDGANFSMFAELALACIEHGVEATKWGTVLETLVRAMHLFVEHVQSTRLADAKALDYATGYTFSNGRYTGVTRIAELRAAYAKHFDGLSDSKRLIDLEHLFCHIEGKAFINVRGWNGVNGNNIEVTADVLEPPI